MKSSLRMKLSFRAAALRSGPARLPWWVKLLLAYLAGITIIGKGPTYLGIPPLFWGEITMILSLLLIAPWVKGSGLVQKNGALTMAVVGFMTLGAVLTTLWFPKWHLNALRDAAIWYYGLFYFVGLGLAARESIADRVWWWLRVFWIASLVWNTADLLSKQRLSHAGPIIPWRGLPLFFNSTHEAGQNLALGAMIVLCTATLATKAVWRAILVPIAILGLAVFSISQGRGMRLGIAAGVLLVMLLSFAPRRPHFSRRLVVLSAAAVPVLALASVVYTDKLVSIAHLDRFEEADPSDPVGTANWRAVWWEHLYDAVMRTDPVFGLGFGESLHLYHPLLWALQEDFVVRSPHNFNVTVFARMGFAGLALWIAILAIGIGGLFRRAWRGGTPRGEPYLPERHDELVFWIMMLVCTVVNSSFGVLMEGPVLGIWFWFALGFANGRSGAPGAITARRALSGSGLRRLRFRGLGKSRSAVASLSLGGTS